MRKPNQNTTRARIVIAGAGVVIAGSRIIITGARIIIAGTPYVLWKKSHKNRFLLTLTLVFSGKIRNEKKMRVHVIPHDPYRPIPEKAHTRKDPSREAPKFTGLENLVPIPSRDNTFQARSAVQVHDCHLYS